MPRILFVAEPEPRHRTSRGSRAGFGLALGVVTVLWALLSASGASATQNTDPSAETETWTGTWATSWTGAKVGSVTVVFVQDGNEVAGDPIGEDTDDLPGFIDSGFWAGLPTPETLVGEWIDDDDRGGTFTLTLGRDGTTWSGPWTDEGATGIWSGTCIAGACLDNVGTAGTSPTPSAAVTETTSPDAATTSAPTETTIGPTVTPATSAVSGAEVPVEGEDGTFCFGRTLVLVSIDRDSWLPHCPSTALVIGALIGIAAVVGGGAVVMPRMRRPRQD
jgi:hypothetical protein